MEMGARDRVKTVHRKSFHSVTGKSAEQYHADHAFPPGAKCICGRPPIIRAIVMIPLDELRKRDPEFDRVASLASINPSAAKQFFALLVPLKTGPDSVTPHIRVSTTYACETCRSVFEKQLAKAPSWAVVEINRGPGPKKVISTS